MWAKSVYMAAKHTALAGGEFMLASSVDSAGPRQGCSRLLVGTLAFPAKKVMGTQYESKNGRQ